jgi:hypothetical protein
MGYLVCLEDKERDLTILSYGIECLARWHTTSFILEVSDLLEVNPWSKGLKKPTCTQRLKKYSWLLCHTNVHNGFHESPCCFGMRRWYLAVDFRKCQIPLRLILKLVLWVVSPPGVLVSTATVLYYKSLDHDLTDQEFHAVDFWNNDQM